MNLLEFSDLDLIFKVTTEPKLSNLRNSAFELQNRCVCVVGVTHPKGLGRSSVFP